MLTQEKTNFIRISYVKSRVKEAIRSGENEVSFRIPVRLCALMTLLEVYDGKTAAPAAEIPAESLYRHLPFATKVATGTHVHIVNEGAATIVRYDGLKVETGRTLCRRTTGNFLRTVVGATPDCAGCLAIGRGIARREQETLDLREEETE